MTYERYQNGVPTTNGAPSSREIQSDVVEIREEMSKTFEEISAKLAPKELLSQLTSLVKGGGATRFLKSFSSSIERNPVPAVLIASGIGYLIYDGMRNREAGDSTPVSEPKELEGSRGGQLAAAGRTVSQRTEEIADRAREGARELAHRASNMASQAAQTTRDVAHKGQELIREQPLVLAGLGIAFGAAIAGSAPLSRTEEKLIGEPAGELMGELQQRAHQIKDRVEHGVRAAGDAAKQALTEQTDDQGENKREDETSGPNT